MQFWEHQKNFFSFYRTCTKEVCQNYDLTQMEFDILMFLSNNPQFDTAAEIVRIRKLTKSHVSVAVNSLIQRNLLKPFHTDNNHKTVHLRLLPAARDIIQSGQQAQEQFRNRLFQGFSEEELQLFRDMTDRILHNASQKEDSHL